MATAIPTRPFHTDRVSLARPLAQPSMAFDLNAELNALRRESAWQCNGHNARTLAKYPDMRIVLAVAQRGVRIKPHEPDERIAIQVLRGHVRFEVGDQVIDAHEGQLVTVDRGIAHEIEAVEESAFVLHVSWPVTAATRARSEREERGHTMPAGADEPAPGCELHRGHRSSKVSSGADIDSVKWVVPGATLAVAVACGASRGVSRAPPAPALSPLLSRRGGCVSRLSRATAHRWACLLSCERG